MLFPATASGAMHAYVTGILRYPGFAQAPPATVAAQVTAVDQWMAGQVRAGTLFGQVRIPLLVADGNMDALDPIANDHMLADMVPGARLVVYPGAGHGFLFQDSSNFLPAMERFLR